MDRRPQAATRRCPSVANRSSGARRRRKLDGKSTVPSSLPAPGHAMRCECAARGPRGPPCPWVLREPPRCPFPIENLFPTSENKCGSQRCGVWPERTARASSSAESGRRVTFNPRISEIPSPHRIAPGANPAPRRAPTYQGAQAGHTRSRSRAQGWGGGGRVLPRSPSAAFRGRTSTPPSSPPALDTDPEKT